MTHHAHGGVGVSPLCPPLPNVPARHQAPLPQRQRVSPSSATAKVCGGPQHRVTAQLGAHGCLGSGGTRQGTGHLRARVLGGDSRTGGGWTSPGLASVVAPHVMYH